jgi:hypothetical protein
MLRIKGLGIATGWTAGVRNPAGARFFSFPQRQTGSGAHPASYQVGTRGIPPRVKRPGVKLISHLHIVPRSRMVKINLHVRICSHGVVIN